MGITGKMWAHEHWNLGNAPDIVTFGGRSHIGGFYSTPEYSPAQYGCAFEQRTDMTKLLNFGLTWKTI